MSPSDEPSRPEFQRLVGRFRKLFQAGRAITAARRPGANARVAFTLDLSDHKPDDPFLREREEFYRTLGEAAPGFVWSADARGYVDYVNRSWVAYTGLSLDEVNRRGWTSVIHPDDLPDIQLGFQTAAERGQPFKAEFRCRAQDGSYRWFLGRAAPVRGVDNQVRRWIGTSVDIDELKGAQEALRRSERRYAEATTAGRVGVFDYDSETGEVYADPVLPTMLGHQPDQCPTADEWLKWIRPADRRRLIELGRSALDRPSVDDDGTTMIPEIECPVFHRDGRVRWVAIRGKVLRRWDGVPQRVIGTVTDVSARKRAELKLQERLEFETLLSELSAALATSPTRRTDEIIPEWLRRIGTFLGAERVSIAEFAPHMATLQVTHDWVADPAAQSSAVVWPDDVAMLHEYARRGKLLRVVSPGAAGGTRSLLGIPLAVGGRPLGMLCLSARGKRTWPRSIASRLQVIGRILANVLGRKQVEANVRRSEALNAAVLASIAGQVAIVDRSGTIIQVNQAWTKSARERSADPCASTGVGANYLDVCRRAASAGDHVAAEVLERLEAVLAGERLGFSLEYSCHLPGGGEHWYEMWVARLARRESGAVVFHVDCTARKRAETEAQRHRQELAHVLRVATMGELASSLAHELNQPLTAILSNAQAARRLLAAASTDLDEVRSVLGDIVENDRRAAEIVGRMRAFLRKGELEMLPVNLGDLVRDVVRLVRGDLIMRQAAVTLDLEDLLPRVWGDRVQLQQVLLNFILNGLEAMSDTPVHDRRLALRAARRDEQSVEVAVHDTGSGVSPQHLDRIFDAFYTTKRHGLGMGLSIARTIVETHGGRVWVANNCGSGATVGFTLPAERDTSL